MLEQQHEKATTIISEQVIGSKSYFKTLFEKELAAKNYTQHPTCLEDYLLMLAVSPERALELQQQLVSYKKSIDFILQDPLQVTQRNLQVEDNNEYLNISKNNLLHGIYIHQTIGQSNFDNLAFDDPNKRDQYRIMKERMNVWIDRHGIQQNNAPTEQSMRYNETLVCALYNSESLEQVQHFVQGHKNSTIIIVVNTHIQLKQDLKDKLFRQFKDHLILKNDQDINLRDAILVLQYTEGSTNILFFITYQQQAHYQLISLVYDQIARHFDPKYLWMTYVNVIPIEDVIKQLISSVQDNAIIGVCPQVQYTLDSCNFFNIKMGLWFQTLKQLYNSDFINFNHDMWYCFYDWKKMNQLPQLKFEEADTDIEFSNISQAPNFLFFNIALLLNQNINEPRQLLFRIQQVPIYAGVTDITCHIPALIDQVRRQENSKYYQSLQFYQFSEKILTVLANRNCWNFMWQWLLIQCMNLRSLFYLITDNIKLSLIVYLSFNCCFQLVHNFDEINSDLQVIIAIIFPITVVLLVLRSIGFSNTFYLKYIFSSMTTIVIKGALCFYSPANQTISKVIIQDNLKGQLQASMKIINQNLIITVQHNDKFYELENREILQLIQQNPQVDIEQIYRLKGTFVFRQQSEPDSNLIVNTFYQGAAINVILMTAFVLDIVYSYLIPDYSAVNLLVLISLVICIICALIECLSSKQKYYFIGFLSNIVYYVPIQLGLHIYSIFNVDCGHDGQKLSQFYYQKVIKVSKLLALNCILMFSYVMIERALGYQGYILYGLIIYKGLESLLTLTGNLKNCCIKQNPQSEIKSPPNSTINQALYSFNENTYLSQLYPQDQLNQRQEAGDQGENHQPYVPLEVAPRQGFQQDQFNQRQVAGDQGENHQPQQRNFQEEHNNEQNRQPTKNNTIKLKHVSSIQQPIPAPQQKGSKSEVQQHMEEFEPPQMQQEDMSQMEVSNVILSHGSSSSPSNKNLIYQREYVKYEQKNIQQ